MKEAIVSGIPGDDEGEAAYGPYEVQPLDPYPDATDEFIAQRVALDVRSFNSASIYCDPDTAEYAYAAVGDSRFGNEYVAISTWALDARILSTPLIGTLNASQDDFFASYPSGEWHEAMHQRRWDHTEGRVVTSVPYIIGECMEQIGLQSTNCTGTCPADQRPVSRFDQEGCDCVADPLPIHAAFQRARGRSANPRELELANALPLAFLENVMNRPVLARAAGAIVVDGIADEVSWNSPTTHVVDTPIANVTPEPVIHPDDASATWKATWDESGVYFFVDVKDDLRIQNHPAADWHLDDSVEIYIAAGSRGESYGAKDFEFGFRPGSDTTVHLGYFSATPAAPIKAVRRNHPSGTDAGYSLEVRVPWTALGVPSGSSLGIEVHINDDDGVTIPGVVSGRESHLAWATSSPFAWQVPTVQTVVSLPSDILGMFDVETVDLDGEDDELNWSVATREDIVRRPAPVQAANGTGFWRAFWSPTHLYLFVEYGDQGQIALDGPNRWDDDSVEVYIDTDNHHNLGYDDQDFQLVFRRGEPGTVHVGGSSATNTAGIQFFMKNVSFGYTLEAAIPWGTLGLTPATGHLLGFDVHINDDDNGGARDGKVSWHSTTDESWRDPSTFGSLRLTSGPAVPELPYASQAPEIDGNVGGDFAWDVWTEDPVELANLIVGATDVDATWRAMWDYDALYLGVEVAEASAPFANSGQAYWEDDSVEVFVDLGFGHQRIYSLSEFQYVFRAANPAFVGSRLAGSEGVEVAVSSTSAGYMMELKIPWAQPALQDEFALPSRRVGVGSAIGFDIHVNDDDSNTGASREGKMAWALSPFSGDVSWSSPQVFGRVTLGR